ncbi:hypothetical protein [Caldimonas caldifontis]|nr:hypothetical protein [Caldimonas caldifontis]
MSTPAIPTKTALGHEELRHRVHRLSQRHRTVLLLVDGVRPLAEVLGMAQKAGASTQHFEDLLKLGLVELPARPDPVPAPPIEEPAGLLVSVPVPVVSEPVPAPAEAAADLPHSAAQAGMPLAPLARALAQAASMPPVSQAQAPAPKAAAAVRPPSPPPKVRPAKSSTPRASRKPPTDPELPPLTLTMPVELPVLTVVEDEPSPETTPSETALHDQVLELLRTVVRREPPPFTSRVPARLARCSTLKELGELVLDIERYLIHSRRDRNLREVMPLLREARDLLGLGNTRVVSAGGEELG